MLISNNELKKAFKNRLAFPDVLTGLNRLNQKASRNCHMDSRINKQIHRGQAARFWKGAAKAGCTQYAALFTDFDVVPKYCFDCYKVVIELRTVVELFKVLLIFERIKLPGDNSRKCMIDQRGYGSVKYKGFVYCRGLEEAKELSRLVYELVADGISPDIKVRVQRGCSEYGQKYPDYAQITSDKSKFQYRKNWKFYEDFVDKYYIFEGNVDCFDEDGKGTDPVREIVAYQFWLSYAASVGDTSYLILTQGKAINPQE